MKIGAQTLAELGGGDAEAGAARLRRVIADLCERTQVSGPTERPQSVRVAARADEGALLRLLRIEANESPLGGGQFSEAMAEDVIRIATRQEGSAMIGVIDGPEGEPVGAVGVYPVPAWNSGDWHLGERFLVVAPESRRGPHARDLVLFARWAADEVSRQIGRRVYLLQEVICAPEISGKERLLNRLSNPCGRWFIYPAPQPAEGAP